MILKHQGLGFVHIPRTGGMSVRKLLRPYCHHSMKKEEHCHASQILNIAEEGGYSLTTFAVVRNPWERMTSMHQRYLDQTGKKFGLRRFLEGIISRDLGHGASQMWYTHEVLDGQMDNAQDYWRPYKFGKCLVDHIFRYEEIHELEKFLSYYLGFNVELPKINCSNRRDYKSYYDDEMIDMVAKMYPYDINVFGYYYDGYHS